MENSSILTLGKYTFWSSFIAGNICLFGYLIFREEAFAICGYLLLPIATIINATLFLSLIIYGFVKKEHLQICLKSAAILLINIPIAWLYAAIGVSLM